MANTDIALEVQIHRPETIDPTKQTPESLLALREATLKTMQQTGSDITNLYGRCRRIKQLEGNPVSVIGIKLTGKAEIEFVELTYLQEKKILVKKFTRDEFYELRYASL